MNIKTWSCQRDSLRRNIIDVKQQNKGPYEALGRKIKHLREQWRQSLVEVSGTLEIDESTLLSIEKGQIMPSENVLNMLISHFLLTDEQADELRNLAEHYNAQMGDALMGGIEDMLMKQIVMYLPVDNKAIFTDSMNATVNDHGVVLQFMQNGPDGKPLPIGRVGMSREHAERMIKVIRSTLDQHDKTNDSKLLPS